MLDKLKWVGIAPGKPDIYLKPLARQLKVNRRVYTSILAGNAVSSRMDCPMVVKSIKF